MLKKLLIGTLTAITLCNVGGIGHTQKTEPSQTETQTLQWKNGDTLPGKLKHSTPDAIHWESPYFSEDLVIERDVLASITWARGVKHEAPALETFRMSTVSGDTYIADIIDSDEDTFHFSSKRHGQFRVKRDAILTLERREHPNLIFDGSHIAHWDAPTPEANEAGRAVRLFGRNAHSNWYADRNGNPRTDTVKSKIFQPLDWPQRFEIDIELTAATRPPGFSFALGKNAYEALRLETWVNELVIVQGTLFESVLTLHPDRRSFHLRLAYDAKTEVLQIFEGTGNLLLTLDNVQQTVGATGIYIYNRGQNLTVRRLRVYRHPNDSPTQHIDATKPRIHMMNGHVLYGKLFVHQENTYVLDENGNRHTLEHQHLDRVVHPTSTRKTIEHPTTLTYPDGTVLHGHIAHVTAEHLSLQTAFATEPIHCTFKGASLLKVDSKETQPDTLPNHPDKLFHPTGTLHGHVHFSAEGNSFLHYKPLGTSTAVQLTPLQNAHIERNPRRASKMFPFDTSQFPHLLHLNSREIIPCHISAYTETTLEFHSPFLHTTRLDAAHVKALEFVGRTHANYTDTSPSTHPRITQKQGNILLQDVDVRKFRGAGDAPDVHPQDLQDLQDLPDLQEFLDAGGVIDVRGDENMNIRLIIDGKHIELRPGHTARFQTPQLDAKLERALTPPRFSRDTPPHHILVAQTGDMKRGKLISLTTNTLRFDSKGHTFSVPLDRVTRVVDVNAPSPQPQTATAPTTDITLRLIDGSLLRFEPRSLTAEHLLGRSAIYGKIKVPLDSIHHLYLGDTTAAFQSAFAAWVVRPAKEPIHSENP